VQRLCRRRRTNRASPDARAVPYLTSERGANARSELRSSIRQSNGFPEELFCFADFYSLHRATTMLLKVQQHILKVVIGALVVISNGCVSERTPGADEIAPRVSISVKSDSAPNFVFDADVTMRSEID
jgi:hypothetical protein